MYIVPKNHCTFPRIVIVHYTYKFLFTTPYLWYWKSCHYLNTRFHQLVRPESALRLWSFLGCVEGGESAGVTDGEWSGKGGGGEAVTDGTGLDRSGN
jgi:hypothetical protein